MDEDDVLQFLIDQIAEAKKLRSEWSRKEWLKIPPVMPTINQSDILKVESQLGFEIPRLLKRIYSKIGNGGYNLGPGAGLIGVKGGYDILASWDIVTDFREMSHSYEWWQNYLVLTDWGGNEISYLDCTDSDYPVYTYNGYSFNPETDHTEPSDELWSVESDTFNEWLMKPNNNPPFNKHTESHQ